MVWYGQYGVAWCGVVLSAAPAMSFAEIEEKQKQDKAAAEQVCWATDYLVVLFWFVFFFDSVRLFECLSEFLLA